MFSKQPVVYLLGCMFLCYFTVVHVQKILLPHLDLLMVVPWSFVSWQHKCFGLMFGTINVSGSEQTELRSKTLELESLYSG